MKTPMRTKTSQLVLILMSVVFVAGVGNANAGAPAMAPAPAMDCMTPIYNMSDCLTYVEQGSNASKPDKACCPELAGLLESNPICLCHLLGKSTDFPISLDINRALQLPQVCGLQAPPVSLCSEIGIPVAAPTSSQGPSTAPTSSDSTASEISPTTEAAEGTTQKNVSYIIACLAIAFALSSIL